MKKVFLIPAVLFFTFCSSKKNNVISTEENKPVYKIESICPSDGKCTVELLRGKSLEIKTDDIGAIYTQIDDNNETSVIIYQYNRTVKGDIQDANYREEIIFEINNSDTKLKLSDKELQQTKMLFGRFCFCRGQTGYYKIEHGDLDLNQNNGAVDFTLDFVNTKVPQIIKSIKTSIN
jgi:hypothetical protein